MAPEALHFLIWFALLGCLPRCLEWAALPLAAIGFDYISNRQAGSSSQTSRS
jgi:hypothetical protein